MVIKTENLMLREFTHEDFPALFEIFSDPETMRHYPKSFDENVQRIGLNGISKTTRYMDLACGLLF